MKVTDEHPFFVLNDNFINVMQDKECNDCEREDSKQTGNWVAAKNLQVGDFLITDNGKKAKIKI